jgi:hypothetical protein
MLIHPWDAALDSAEWQDWLAATGRFGMLAVNNLDPARAPLVLPLHFLIGGRSLCIGSGSRVEKRADGVAAGARRWRARLSRGPAGLRPTSWWRLP